VNTPARRTASARSPFEQYLHEIDRTPLLSAADEQDLARKIKDGDTEARDWMVRANLRLVVSIARGFANRGLGLEDLIAEGNMGLLRAVEGYEPGMNTRFSTYAAYWVRQSIRRGLHMTGRTVRLPVYMTALLTDWRRMAAAMQEELGRAATDGEIAVRLGLGDKKVAAIKKAMRMCATGAADGPADAEAGGLTDGFVDERTPAPDDALAGAEVMQLALESIGKLDEREQVVVKMRFGLNGESPRTLQEVGDVLGCTRERARQIEQSALHKLRDYVQAA
jgi:RNA polymerase primary sigma factor